MAITAQTRTEIVQLVVSMLGEAPSTAMLTDLVTKANAGSTIQELADSLATNAAFTGQFPVWQTATEFTTKIVNSMFAGGAVSQADTDAAIDYIAGAITAGTFTKTSAVVALTSYMASEDGVANATYGSASQSYQNKVAVAEYYTITKGLGDGTAAERKAAIAGVTSDAATVTSEKAAADTSATAAAVVPPTSQTLTTGTDVKNGGAGADQFLGVVGATSTLTAGDLLTGGAGEDTLQVTLTGGADLSVSGVVSNGIEKYMVSNFTTVDVADDSIDMSQAAGISTIALSGSNGNGDTVFTNVGAIVSAEMLNGTGDLTITNTNASVVGLADAASLTLSGQTASTFTEGGAAAGGLETINVASNGATNAVNITSANNSLKTVNISGASKLTTTVGSTALATVNAADMTGKFNLTTNVTGDLTVTGGSAADTFTFAGTTYTNADVIDGGDGIDALITGTAVTAASTLKNVSNVESLVMTGGAGVTLAGDANIMNFGFNVDTGINALVLNAGVTAPVTVTLGLTGADTVNNAASTTLTVNGVAAAIDLSTAITGGALGADTINITADTDADAAIAMSTMTNIDVINVLDNGDAAITAAKKAAGKDVSLTTGAYATAITIDASALDAAITDDDGNLKINDSDESAERLTVDGSGATKALTVKGGEAGDTITGGSANDVIHGNGGADTITLTAGGNDTVEGGAGNDTIIAGATLNALDTVDGGDGIDTLTVTTLTNANLVGISNVEVLAFNGTVSLTGDLDFTTLNLTAGSNADSVTFGTGYTNATTVSLEDNDTVINNAKIAMTVEALASNLEAADNVTITGSALSADVMTVTATSSTMATSGSITNVDSITVKDAGDAATGATAAGQDFTIDLASYNTKLTIDASALDVASIDSNSNGKIQANDASNENFVITGVSAKALTVTGGGADDTILGSSDATAGDTISAGVGDDTIDMADQLTYQDTIDGGDNGLTGGGDTLKVAIDQADINFMNVTNVETLSIDEGNTSTNVLGAYFTSSGIGRVLLDPTHVSTISAAGTTSGVTYVATGAQNEAITAGLGDDTFVFGAATITNADVINGGAGVDTIAINNNVNTTVTANVDLQDVTKVEAIATIDANGDDTTTPEADAVTVNILYNNAGGLADNGVDGTDVAMSISGASITDTLDVFTVDASAIQDTDYTFTITGGAAKDALTGGGGADTISGGGGADVITGDKGADTLTGGAGKDDFVYALASSQSTNAKTDTITDFATGSDEVRISFTGGGGDTLDFTNKGNAATNADALGLLSSKIGQYYYNTTTQTVVLDVDANGLAQSTDFAVNMGLAALGAADIAFDVTSGTSANTVTTGGGNDTGIFAFATDSFTMGAGNDRVSIGNVNASGTIAMGTGTDTLVATHAGADVIDATVSGLSAISIGETFELDVSIAQLATFKATAGFTISGVAAGQVETIKVTGTNAAETIDASGIVFTNASAILLGGDAADAITGGNGNDYLDGAAGNDVDTLSGGAGDDTYAISDESDADIFAEAASAGTDTIFFTNAFTLVGDKFGATAASATANGSLANWEQVVVDQNTTATFSSAMLTGTTLAVNASAAGTATVAVTATAAAAANTIDLSGLTIASFTYAGADGESATGVAFDANDVVTVAGGSAVDTIKSMPTVINTIDGSGGADLITLASGADKLVYDGAADGGATGDVVTAFTTGTDTISIADALTQDGTGAGAAVVKAVGNADAATALTLAAADVILLGKTANANAVDGSSASISVTAANLGTVADIIALVNDQMNLTASGAVDTTVIAVESSDVTGSFGLYHWTPSSTGDAALTAGEVTILGIYSGDGIAAGDFLIQ